MIDAPLALDKFCVADGRMYHCRGIGRRGQASSGKQLEADGNLDQTRSPSANHLSPCIRPRTSMIK